MFTIIIASYSANDDLFFVTFRHSIGTTIINNDVLYILSMNRVSELSLRMSCIGDLKQHMSRVVTVLILMRVLCRIDNTMMDIDHAIVNITLHSIMDNSLVHIKVPIDRDSWI